MIQKCLSTQILGAFE